MADDECKQEECPPGAPLWMCTFADLMSLLLCFFVLLLSFSVMDATKYKRAAGSMKDAFGVQKEVQNDGSPQGQLMISTSFISTPLAVKVQRDINDVVALESGGLVDMDITHDGVIVTVKDKLGFEFGKAKLRPQFKVLLDKIGKIIKQTGSTVIVSGHTDNIPLRRGGKFISNWDLSTARSVAVVNYWEQRFNILSEKMSAVGYADGKPVASNKTAEGRSRNRRVEFKIKVNEKASSFAGLKELLLPKPVISQ